MWAKIPPFEYSPPALSDVLLRCRLAILVLFIWLVGSGIAAISAVRALRP
jgi:hypothetical protein